MKTVVNKLEDRREKMIKIEKRLDLQLYIDFDHVMIYLILVFSFLNTFYIILLMQTGTSIIWRRSFQYIRILLLLSSVIYIAAHYITERRLGIRPWILNTFMYLLYMCIPTILFFHPSILSFIIGGFVWPLTYVAYYIYAEKNEFSPLYKKSVFYFCFACAIAMIKTITTRGSQGTNTGSVYYLVSFLPMVLFLCDNREKIVLSFLMVIFAVLSLKRGAILEISIGLMGYYIYKLYQDDSSKKKGKILFLLFLLFILLLGFNQRSIGNQVVDRFISIADDGGSGREQIWNYIIHLFNQSPIIKKIIGHGYLAFPYEHGYFGYASHAHNGYIEALYDLGLVGSIWLGIIVISMCYSLIRRLKTKNEIIGPSITALWAVLILSMVSYFFEECGHIVMIASFWGIYQGKFEKYNLEKNVTKVKTEYKYIKSI